METIKEIKFSAVEIIDLVCKYLGKSKPSKAVLSRYGLRLQW